ncbi:hypothetical protein CPB84DRAFT_1754294 [Gymnopilus junonius]|uniref:Uncharacterized protein n=1 Tax=Gymnopilus junonius TaxID=109634 RepID=A0A9P5N8N6_GYMJU|nr:hypothetical protein CPB84DRAFT_1754294 [Gymnopilus junonius]
MVYMKATAIALLAAGSIAPVLASYYNEDYLEQREVSDELAEVLAREYGYDLAREYENYERISRRGFYDVDDLFERSPSMVEDVSFASRDLQPEYAELLTRYFNDLEEREPDPNVIEWFKNLFHHKKKDDKKTQSITASTTTSTTATTTPTPTPAAQDNVQAPTDNGASAGTDPSTVSSRELYGRDDIEYEELVMRYFDDMYKRGLAAEVDSSSLSARKFEDNLELLQRSPDPNIIEWFKNLFHHKKKDDKKAASTTTTTSSTTTSLPLPLHPLTLVQIQMRSLVVSFTDELNKSTRTS